MGAGARTMSRLTGDSLPVRCRAGINGEMMRRGQVTAERRGFRGAAGHRSATSDNGVYVIVRRDKVRIFSGCKSHPANSVAPAGSYRSGGGGNETAGAFEKTGRSSGPASPQAVTRVNVEQASKGLTWEPTRL